MDAHERHVRASRQAAAGHAAESIDPNAVVTVITDAEELIGWKQLTVKQRIGAISTLVTAASALIVSIVTAVS